MRTAGLLLATGLLAGCSNSSSFNPVNWWHSVEGGKIAEERPQPPGADQPYPDLNTVPSRPAAPDQDALRKLTAALVADRTNAQHEAQSTPLADPSSPSASPNLFGVGTAPPPGAPPPGAPSSGASPSGASASSGAPAAGSGASTAAPAEPPVASASMPAVTAPPPPPAPPAPAPRKAVQSAPLAPAPAVPPSEPSASDSQASAP
ncbi:MAG TPA: hypothetical protein VHC04_00005, partial [Rhodopila sp.]|nr:hypothetical protein [Rhodopila sp.]